MSLIGVVEGIFNRFFQVEIINFKVGFFVLFDRSRGFACATTVINPFQRSKANKFCKPLKVNSTIGMDSLQ